MKLGLQIPSFSWPGGTEAIGPTLGGIARQADDIGLDSIWVNCRQESNAHPGIETPVATGVR